MSDTTPDSDRIERDLSRTRSRLDANLDALQQRLSPGQVIDQAVSYFKGSEGADMGKTLVRQAQAQPMALALVGIGVAWMMMGSNRPATPGYTPSRDDAADRYGRRETGLADATYGSYGTTGGAAYGVDEDHVSYRARRAGETLAQRADETADAFRHRVAEARAGVMGLTQSAGEAVSTFADRVEQALEAATRSYHDARDALAARGQSAAEAVRGTAQQAYDAVRGGVDQAYGTVRGGVDQAYGSVRGGVTDAYGSARGSAGQAARYGSDQASYAYGAARSGLSSGMGQARSLGDNAMEVFQQHPVLLGALGVTVGALLGAMMPSTRQERQMFGELGERARDELGDASDQMLGRAEGVADRLVGAGGDLVSRAMEAGRGLADQALDTGRGLATDALNQAKDIVREEGVLGGGSSGPSQTAPSTMPNAGGTTTMGTTGGGTTAGSTLSGADRPLTEKERHYGAGAAGETATHPGSTMGGSTKV